MKKTINLPQNYLDAMKELLKEDYEDYLASFEEKRLYGLRINTLKISVEDFLKISPFELEPIPWIENGFYFHEEDKPAKHPYYFAGLYYIQEPSAMTPANVLPVEDGDVVFDMCAAPGGKSTELGAKLDRTGLLITNDISNSRAKALLKNVEVFGIPNLCVLSEDPKKIADRFTGFFDKVLIDAPCSGEGMFRKDNKLIKSWEKNGPEFYSKIQRDIVLSGADMLKPGGKMLYSTCTFSKLEDEETIRHMRAFVRVSLKMKKIRQCRLKNVSAFSLTKCREKDIFLHCLKKIQMHRKTIMRKENRQRKNCRKNCWNF